MKVRIIKNHHGTARAALEKWLAGSLWGNPIQMGPDKFHVYGISRHRLRNGEWIRWRPVQVEFTAKQITVMHNASLC